MATFFVSYTGADKDWAEWIAWELEAAGHKAIIQAWDFRPGMNFVLEMDEATKADHTVAVLSPSYVEAVFTRPEWTAAFAQDATGRSRRLIPVRVRPVELTGLLSQIIYIDMLGKTESVARQTLLEGVSEGRAKPSSVRFPGGAPEDEPAFPGTSEAISISAPPSAIDPGAVLESARKALSDMRSGLGPCLHVAVEPCASGPLLRPSAFDTEELAEGLLQEALFGARILSREDPSPLTREKGVVSISQPNASFEVNERGRVLVSQRAITQSGLAIIEEDLLAHIERALRFAGAALSMLDEDASVTCVGIASCLEGADYVGWKTRAEHSASPHSASIPAFGRKPQVVDVGRLVQVEELRTGRAALATDLLALLRREIRG